MVIKGRKFFNAKKSIIWFKYFYIIDLNRFQPFIYFDIIDFFVLKDFLPLITIGICTGFIMFVYDACNHRNVQFQQNSMNFGAMYDDIVARTDRYDVQNGLFGEIL